MKRLFSFVVRVAPLVVAVPVYAAEVDPTNFPLGALQVVVSDLYAFSLSIVGLCVFVMFLIAGLSYIVPDGFKPTWMASGKSMDIIKDAIIGMVLLFSSFLILNSINPDLVGSNATAPSSQSSASSGSGPLPQAANAKPAAAAPSDKTTSRNGVTFRDTGSICSSETQPCVPGNSCQSGVCAMAPNGTLPDGAYCLNGNQCAGGSKCDWYSYVGGNMVCSRIGSGNPNAEGI